MPTIAPVPTSAVYRPRCYAETEFDPGIEIDPTFLSGSFAHGGTVASVNPDQVVGSSDDPYLMVIMEPRRPARWSEAVHDLIDGVFEKLLEHVASTVETFSVSESTFSVLTLREPPRESRPSPPAFAAFKDVVRWLEAPDGDVAEAVEIGRTTPYAWRREGHGPRASTTRRMYEYHAVLSSLRRRLGPTEFHRWLFTGRPSPRELLLAGDLDRIESQVHGILFPRVETGVDLAWAPEDSRPEEMITPPAPAIRPSSRRPRRAKLP